MAYKIEKNIPIPPQGQGRNGGAQKVVLEMEVGDSVLVDKSKVAYFYLLGKKHNKKMVARTVEHKKIRVWCVAQS
jgi:hypothetical protein